MDFQKESFAILLLVGFLHGACGALYTVGGNSGWIELQQGSTAYDDQFRDIKLVVGDQLKFPYSLGAHNVYQVTATQLASCNGTDPIAQHTDPDTIVTLDAAGYWGFICEIGDHCSAGAMHLAVNVSAASAPTPSPSTAPVATPVQAPAATPVQAPVATPVEAPVPAPAAQTPTPTPSRAPTTTPTPSTTPVTSVSPASAPSSPESGLSPSETPAEGPNGEFQGSSGAHSLLSAPFAVLLTSAAACLAILVL